MRNNKSNKGFTLIELLIVIAIIGILAAVLIPNLLSARTRANDTAVQSFLQQAATAQEMYQIDHNTYAEDLTDLQTDTFGLKDEPANITAAVDGADAGSYCIEASHSAGTTGGFH